MLSLHCDFLLRIFNCLIPRNHNVCIQHICYLRFQASPPLISLLELDIFRICFLNEVHIKDLDYCTSLVLNIVENLKSLYYAKPQVEELPVIIPVVN